jgi:3-oxoacyl-[acyl-carrier protein] reductase
MNSHQWPNIEYDYTNATVLVTGGSNGIGEGIAKAYQAAGATVHITGTRANASDYEKDLSGLNYHQLQVTEADNIQDVAKVIPELDILINNAGASLPGGKDEYDPEVFELALTINLTSAYRMAQACKDALASSQFSGGASIISMGSLTSLFGNEVVPGYGAAKAGLVQLTKTLGIAWAEQNIRVNAVAAGLIETNMTAAMLTVEEMTQPFIDRTPMKRVGTPHDIAGAVLFLSSSAAAFITGQTLPVDGGYSIRG